MAIGDALLTGVQDLKGKWDQWMSDPANRAALLQTGVALMQPMSIGQNALGQVGQAIGQGAEAKGRYEDTQRSEDQIAYERQQQEQNRQFQETQANRNYGLEARKTSAIESNAASLAQTRKLNPGGLGALFARDQDQLSTKLWQAAAAEAKNHNDSLDSLDPNFVPKTPQDFLADPAWMARTTQLLNGMPGMPGNSSYGAPPATAPSANATPGAPAVQPPKVPTPGAAVIRRNPTTGQMVQLKGNQWVPYP
jgi:hypothetical protein